MARKNSKKAREKRQKALSVLIFVLAALLLVSLATHRDLDDARIVGEVDRHLNPFDIQYRNQAGMMGAYVSYMLLTLIGWLAYFAPVALILAGLRLFPAKIAKKLEFNGVLLFVMSLLGTMIYNIHLQVARGIGPPPDSPGGYVAEKLTLLSLKLAGEVGCYLILSGFIVMLLILYTSVNPMLASNVLLPGGKWLRSVYQRAKAPVATVLSFEWLGAMLSGWTNSRVKDEEEEDPEASEDFGQVLAGEMEMEPPPMPDDSDPEPPAGTSSDGKARRVSGKPAKQLQLKSVEYVYPKIEALNENPNPGASVKQEELDFTARMLKETLETFNVGVQGDIESHPGPVITRYEFKPAAGIKVNQIIGLSDDLALALKAQRIRIIAPIPGKAAVGVEIPNRDPQMVYMREILSSQPFLNSKLILPIALGKTTGGRPYVADLAQMPHLLIAGATGSGKSVCMNVLITSFLFRLHPQQVRFIFIDPKMLELSVYSGIPHMARPVVTKPKRAEKVLSDAVVEMEKRYRKLAEASVRNIVEYNKKQKEAEDRLPYIVICVDELADLMMSSSTSKTELLITRLAQMSRAVGIHLVLATQRPSVDVITGLIKANFPARIAFQVSSKVDSRTIIDGNGAEKLLGNGDMLFLGSGSPEPIRLHGAYMTSEETDAIVQTITEQGLPQYRLDSISQGTGEPSKADIDFGDPLFKEACDVVVQQKQGSVSLLQRRLGIGYQRAARLIDKLEQAGIVSPFDGSKAREVMVDKAYIEHLFANPNAAPPPMSAAAGDPN